MKSKYLLVMLFAIVYCLTLYSQQKTEIIGGAPPNTKSFITSTVESGVTTFSAIHQAASDSFETTVYTFGDLVVFSYFNDTHVKIYDQSANLIDESTLPADTIFNVNHGGGIFRIVSNKSFTILVGDAINNYVNGYFAVDEAGKGVSLKLNTWMMRQFNSSQDEFVIFAYEDNTGFTVKNLETKEIIYASTLNKGKYFSFRKAGLLSSIYQTALQVSGTKPVSALSYTDQDYYVPSTNGTFTGTEFYGYSAYEGSWTNSITITSYADNNYVIIKDIDDGSTIDSTTLMKGQVYSKGIYAPTYWRVVSQGPVTAANIPYYGWTGSYYYMTRAIDETGTGAGKLFYVPTIASNIRVFSFQNGNNVKITSLGTYLIFPYSSPTEVYSGTLNYGEFYSFSSQTGNMVYKIEGTGNVAVLQSNGGAGADFMPLSYAAKLPDLTLSVDDISFSVPDSVYVPGDVVKVTITVRNTGAVDALNVPVVAYDGDPDIGSAVPVANGVLSTVKAASSATYEFNFTIPIRPEYHSLVVKIDPNNFVVEANKSNNKAQRFLRANKDLLPPLSVSTTSPSALTLTGGNLTPNPFTVRYDIFNTGTVSASNVQVNLVLANGLTLASGTNLISLGNISANGSAFVEYSVRANKDSSGFNTFTATITASNADTKVIYRAINIPDNTPPAAPTNFSGSAIGNKSASFSWNANTEKDHGGYYLYYGTTVGNWEGVGSDQGNSPLLVTGKTNYTVTGLPLNNNQTTTYYFKLKAFDQSINLSNDSQVLTIPINNNQVTANVKFSIAVHQNPAATKYANIIIASESALRQAPGVSIKSTMDSVSVPMTLVSNSTTVYTGSYVFKTSSSHAIYSTITTETGATKDSMRTVNVTLAKPGEIASVSSLDKKASLTIAPNLLDKEAYFISEILAEDGAEIYSFSPGISFNDKLKLEIKYDRSRYYDASKLFVYQKTDEGWTPVRSQVYPSENKVTAYISSLGKFKIAVNETYAGDNSVPEIFSLKQNYPNPFNPVTTIQYDLPENDHVGLIIYNVLGKQVATLVNGFQLAGKYTLTWNAMNDVGERLSSGIYFYQIRTSTKSEVKKMILMK